MHLETPHGKARACDLLPDWGSQGGIDRTALPSVPFRLSVDGEKT